MTDIAEKVRKLISVLKLDDLGNCEFRTEREIRCEMDGATFALPYYRCQNGLKVCRHAGMKQICKDYHAIKEKMYK